MDAGVTERGSVKCLVTAGYAGIREKIDKFFAGIEHPGLHCALWDHPSDLFNRLLAVVGEVDDFAIDRRELGNAVAQDGVGLVAIQRPLGSVGLLGDFADVLLVHVFVAAAPIQCS